MKKFIKLIMVFVIAFIVGGTLQYIKNGNKTYRPTLTTTTTTETNAVQQALESGANANNQPDVARYKQQFVSSCIASVPNSSKGMQDYCKCMGDKVIDTYGVYKVADMGLSMTQDQLETELMPLANQCIGELGVQL